MRLLFVADGRSPIAINWIRYFVDRGDEVHLVSTYPCAAPLAVASFEVVPVAFSGRAKRSAESPQRPSSGLGLRTILRDWLGPLTVPRAARVLRPIIMRVKPHLVHSMRIPFEGMLAADAYTDAPLLVSVWGNDFTLHAGAGPFMRHYTAWVMHVADALHTDCRRDVRLAGMWGRASGKPTLVVPGNGGVRIDLFHPPTSPVGEPVVLNPRGARTYVLTEVFLQAIPIVLASVPNARFLCSSLASDTNVRKIIHRLRIADAVELLPPLPYDEMADVFRQAQVVVSPSIHDGTPNSLLEAMACGCLPVAGDLESVREWITPGKNGLLVDVTDPESMARGIIEALQNRGLRHRAADLNQEIVSQRAEYTRCMQEAASFYRRIAPGS